MGMGRMWIAAALLGIAIILPATVRAAEIKVLASAAIKEAYGELVPAFERATENKVVTTWAGTVDVMKRIRAGESFDLVIVAGPSIDELTKEGKIVAGSRVDLVKSGVGAAVRAGMPKPDISSVEALKRALLAAKSVGYSTGPSGVYLAGLFDRMGLTDAIKPKLNVAPPGVSVGEVVARGEAEIGFQQVPELLPVAGIDFIGPLPAEVQQMTVFAGGIQAGAKEAEAAKALINFITTPAAAPVIRKHGLEPG